MDGRLLDLLVSLGATGKADEVVKLATLGKLAATVVLAAGLGKPGAGGAIGAEQVRRASGAAARAMAGVKRAGTVLSAIDLGAAVEGVVLGAYRFDRYKSSTNGDQPVGRVDLVSPAEGTAKDHKATLKAATAIAESVTFARDLINTPPNDLFPASFAQRAAELAGANGVEVEILDEKALRKEGYGGILGVGSGSTRPPRLVRLGGGFELALACDYRVATSKSRVGLPEIKLGLLPGAGGTQRLPRLIGANDALQMMLKGDMVKAPDAHKKGVLDAVVDDAVSTAAKSFAGKPKRRLSQLKAELGVANLGLFATPFVVAQAHMMVPPEENGGYARIS